MQHGVCVTFFVFSSWPARSPDRPPAGPPPSWACSCHVTRVPRPTAVRFGQCGTVGCHVFPSFLEVSKTKKCFRFFARPPRSPLTRPLARPLAYWANLRHCKTRAQRSARQEAVRQELGGGAAAGGAARLTAMTRTRTATPRTTTVVELVKVNAC
jgi:hypothetical protein